MYSKPNCFMVADLEKQDMADVTIYGKECEFCGDSFDTIDSLVKHMVNHHDELWDYRKPAEESLKCIKLDKKILKHLTGTEIVMETKRSIECKFCKKTSKSLDNLVQHMLFNHPGVALSAYECGGLYLSADFMAKNAFVENFEEYRSSVKRSVIFDESFQARSESVSKDLEDIESEDEWEMKEKEAKEVFYKTSKFQYLVVWATMFQIQLKTFKNKIGESIDLMLKDLEVVGDHEEKEEVEVEEKCGDTLGALKDSELENIIEIESSAKTINEETEDSLVGAKQGEAEGCSNAGDRILDVDNAETGNLDSEGKAVQNITETEEDGSIYKESNFTKYSAEGLIRTINFDLGLLNEQNVVEEFDSDIDRVLHNIRSEMKFEPPIKRIKEEEDAVKNFEVKNDDDNVDTAEAVSIHIITLDETTAYEESLDEGLIEEVKQSQETRENVKKYKDDNTQKKYSENKNNDVNGTVFSEDESRENEKKYQIEDNATREKSPVGKQSQQEERKKVMGMSDIVIGSVRHILCLLRILADYTLGTLYCTVNQ